MKEKLLKLLEFDINTAETECSYLPLANGNILFVLENTRKAIIVEQEFTPEEFEIVKTVFELVDTEENTRKSMVVEQEFTPEEFEVVKTVLDTESFIGDSVKVTLDKRELAALSKLNVIQLAQDLEHGLVHSGMLREDMDIATYLRQYFLKEYLLAERVESTTIQSVDLKRYKVDLYFDKELKRYADTDIVEADCVENITVSRPWFFKQVEEDVELEQAVLFSATVTKKCEDGYGYAYTEYLKTIYVQANSYQEGTAKLTEKYKKYRGVDSAYYLGRVIKEEKTHWLYCLVSSFIRQLRRFSYVIERNEIAICY